MDDKILLNKISDSLKELCRAHKIKKIHKLSLIVDSNSNINSSNLYEHLQNYNRSLIGDSIEIDVKKEALDKQVAILHSIEGDKLE